MNRTTAKEVLKNKEPIFLERARQKINNKDSFICPSCGNGSGRNGTGIARVPNKNSYKCFSCGLHEDVIGLWKIANGISDDKQAFDELYQYYGINVDDTEAMEYQMKDKTEQKTSDKVQVDLTAYINKCAKEAGNTDYFKSRGLSEAVIKKYKLGYDDCYTNSTGGSRWKAVIIPTGQYSYVARNTDVTADNKNRYRKEGASQLYLKGTIEKANSPIFVVEGELDALSIIEVGGIAIGLGSTANANQFIRHIEANRPKQPIILALDTDENGQKTATELEKKLVELDVAYHRCNPYGDCKDANEALMKNRASFTEAINVAISDALNKAREEIELEKEEYLKTSTEYHLQNFIDGIAESVNTPYIPTGFNNIDTVLDGGLYEGLYILGAISSLGKTTLALQIADQIAESGQDVLIFSLEMARNELIAKSISRITALTALEKKIDISNAKTTRGITTGSRYNSYSQKERELIQESISVYNDFSKHIYIHEGVGDIGTGAIRKAIERHIRITKNKPVVFIDYIQILAPADIRATDKQNTDKAVTELKRISRDFKIPVIGISSVNRASYHNPATMEMLKESGSLEYGSDCVLGLQLKGVGENGFDVNIAKEKNPREIELIVLKNRNGATGGKLNFLYRPMFNYFEEKE